MTDLIYSDFVNHAHAAVIQQYIIEVKDRALSVSLLDWWLSAKPQNNHTPSARYIHKIVPEENEVQFLK